MSLLRVCSEFESARDREARRELEYEIVERLPPHWDDCAYISRARLLLSHTHSLHEPHELDELGRCGERTNNV